MSDQFVEELLKQWGVLPLLDRCKEQEVDLEALRTFKEDVVTELVPLIGPRCKFLKGWRAWREAGAPTPTCSATVGPCVGPVGPSGEAADRDRQFGGPSPARARSPAKIPELAEGQGGGAAGRQIHQAVASASCFAAVPAAASESARPPLTAASLASWDQPGPSGSCNRREVSVFLEGKITYDDDNSATGWLAADGFINAPQKHRDSSSTPGVSTEGPSRPWLNNQNIVKMEPLDEEYPGLAIGNDLSRSGARFQLQGRISLSLQDFAEVPAFMLGSPMAMEDVGVETTLNHPDSDALTAVTSFAAFADNSHSLASTPTTDTATAETLHIAKRAKRGRDDKLDLQALLNSSSKGKMILSLYQQKGSLDGPARQALTDVIIADELREDLNRKITSQRFQDIAESIVDLFPGENVDTYFYNDRAYGERPGGKGKLTSKYYNTRRQLAKSGVISRGHFREKRQQAPLSSLQLSPGEQESAQDSFKWLQNLGWQIKLTPKDLEIVMARWCQSWKIRMLRILSAGHHPAVYVDEFPVLRMALGETLIKADFDMIFQADAGNRLMSEWPNFSSNVLNMLLEDHRKQLPLLDYVKRRVLTAKGRQAAALLLLPSLLPIITCKGQGENAELWRPTRQEAQDGFLLHIQRDEDANAALAKHWARMRIMGQPMCPLPVVIGPSLDELQSAIVALDENTVYSMPDVLSAVDLCFKCFHALQHAVYQVSTPSDRMSVAVSSLLADFGFRPVPSVTSWDQVLQRS